MNKKIYLKGMDISVSEEIYRAYNHPDWNIRKEMHRHKKCSQENWKNCSADCGHCSYQREGNQISIDHLRAESPGFDIELPDGDPAKIVEFKMLMEAMCEEASRVVPNGCSIFIRFLQGYSDVEGAEYLGIPYGTYNDRKKRVFQKLGEFYKQY